MAEPESQPKAKLQVYNGSDLADVVGYSRGVIQSAKNMGFKFSHGTRTTQESWWKWLMENPEFRSRQGFQRDRLRRPDYSRSRKTKKASTHLPAPDDNLGEP